jgi:hypothetical protein
MLARSAILKNQLSFSIEKIFLAMVTSLVCMFFKISDEVVEA